MNDFLEKPGQEEKGNGPEIILRMLRHIVGDLKPATVKKWKSISRQIPPGSTVHYNKASLVTGVITPSVELRDACGATTSRWEPARLKSVKKARPHKNEKGNRAEIQILTEVPASHGVAVSVGMRMLALAALFEKRRGKR